MFAARGAGPAAAAPGTGGEADTLARLYAVTCLDHAGALAALRTTLGRRPFRSVPPDRAGPLLRRPGLAFEVPGDPGHAVLLSFDDGWCGAGAGGVDPRGLTVALSALVAARGNRMELMDAGGDGAEQHYMLHRPGAAPMVLLVLLHDAGGGRSEATLFSAVMPSAGPSIPNGSPPP